MGKLSETQEFIFAKNEELAVEGINSIDYWFARYDIDLDEYQEHQDMMLYHITSDPNFHRESVEQKLRVIITQGFLLGVVYGRRREGDEF
jgi:hypothetical protein